ncbi:MAG: phosphoribosylglycinamide formyltransferase [Bacteroidales bacterium]|nr:phosphoribosylglycinamide formyltransferase [Bacteroidales bacterium]
MKRIAIFASGSGTNAQRIAEYFNDNPVVEITRIYCNNPHAFVLARAKKLNIPSLVFDRKSFYESESVINSLLKDQTDLIVLAGFLWLVPLNILRKFHNRIINIHPALLPEYGGKGMYGMHVHETVLNAGDKESGISIHYVNERYDEGKLIFQAKCSVDENETPESLAGKIHQLEYEHYPRIIEKILIEM